MLAQPTLEETVMTVAAMLRHKGQEIISVGPTDRVSAVAELLSRRRIGAVMVLDAAEQLLGIVSERDIVHAIAANGARALEMTAGQLMTRALRTAKPETTTAEAMALMTQGRFRHLPVVSHGELVGIVSIGDVVKARMMQQEHEVDSLRAYVAGSA
jgi:CBS domain-containing protein